MTRVQQAISTVLAFSVGWFGRGAYEDYISGPVDSSQQLPAAYPDESGEAGRPASPVNVKPDARLTPLSEAVQNQDYRVPAEPAGGYDRLPSGAVNDLRGG